MIVSIHQPNLFPWMGFFEKMAASDIMILLDHVPYSKRSYQNRVKIKGPHGTKWLTIPVQSKGNFAQVTNEVLISGDKDWKTDHVNTLQFFYRSTPQFNDIFPKIQQLYEQLNVNNLIDFTIPTIELIKGELGINTKLIKASTLHPKGKRSELLAELVKEVGGTTYLSGPTGKDYLEEKYFMEVGVEIDFHSFQPFEYPQPFGEFTPGLSTLDFLFNVKDLSLWKGLKRL
ncbi:WbqC family protein [Bacillus pinisoli]|uniref:WbqC family protein n=1 Tax=Bacillus pinisoli TaxID=2901866 RepID=UPI001FF30250|nr:WbqC family protein [Bacillus pinisoli]